MSELVAAAGFTEQMKQVIVSWPLYRAFCFSGDVIHREVRGRMVDTWVCVPRLIEMECPECRKGQQWQVFGNDADRITSLDAEYQRVVYYCRNCGKAKVQYFFNLQISPRCGTVVKIGHVSPQEISPSQPVASSLDKDDLKFYRQALTLRNHNLGIAAVAYLRRIIENNRLYSPRRYGHLVRPQATHR
jgi:hypothetical protein